MEGTVDDGFAGPPFIFPPSRSGRNRLFPRYSTRLTMIPDGLVRLDEILSELLYRIEISEGDLSSTPNLSHYIRTPLYDI